MSTLVVRLGQRIARHRKAIGLTQAGLAEMVNVQPETICRIETGQRSVSLSLIAKLSQAMDLDLPDFFRFQKPNSPKDQAIERLLWFASRLSLAEIELVLDVGASVLVHTRRMPSE